MWQLKATISTMAGEPDDVFQEISLPGMSRWPRSTSGSVSLNPFPHY
jgi:hypothetical protein